MKLSQIHLVYDPSKDTVLKVHAVNDTPMQVAPIDNEFMHTVVMWAKESDVDDGFWARIKKRISKRKASTRVFTEKNTEYKITLTERPIK